MFRGVLGADLGFAVGVGPGLGDAPKAVAWFSVVGCTVGLGFLAYRSGRHEVERVIYHAPDRGLTQ